MRKIFITLSLILASCTTTPKPIVSKDSVDAGSKVTLGGKNLKLANEGGNIRVGKPIDVFVKPIANPDLFKGKVSLISVVPSIDTAVCEEQTHILSEDKNINPLIQRVTISRDTSMAQNRFSKEAKTSNVIYYSDFLNADFGNTSGLLILEKGLLARAIMVTDQKGVVRYLQIVPNVAELPDMTAAINFANSLL